MALKGHDLLQTNRRPTCGKKSKEILYEALPTIILEFFTFDEMSGP